MESKSVVGHPNITTICLDPEVKAVIREKAKKVNMSLSAYIRKACLDSDMELVIHK